MTSDIPSSQGEELEYLHAEMMAEVGEVAQLRLVSCQRLRYGLLRFAVDKFAKV